MPADMRQSKSLTARNAEVTKEYRSITAKLVEGAKEALRMEYRNDGDWGGEPHRRGHLYI